MKNRIAIIFTAAFILLSGLSSVFAQNVVTNFRVLGYSPDGRYFAYEEFGREGISGRSYATVYVKDLSTSLFVLGTPATQSTLSDDRTSADMVVAVEAQTQSVLDDLSIGVPGIFLALNGDGVKDIDRSKLTFGLARNDGSGGVGSQFNIQLEHFDIISSSDCLLMQDSFRPQGFKLTLETATNSITLHRDAVLSRLRGCPNSYEIKGAVVPLGAVNLNNAVIIISSNHDTEHGAIRQFLPISLKPTNVNQ